MHRGRVCVGEGGSETVIRNRVVAGAGKDKSGGCLLLTF